MNLPEALRECADMLTLAGTALKRIVASETAAEGSDITAYLEKVLDIASQLQKLGAQLEAISSGKAPPN